MEIDDSSLRLRCARAYGSKERDFFVLLLTQGLRTWAKENAGPSGLLVVRTGKAHSRGRLCHTSMGLHEHSGDPRKAAIMRNCLEEVLLSLLPQSCQGVDSGGAARWNPRGEQRDRKENYESGAENHGILR